MKMPSVILDCTVNVVDRSLSVNWSFFCIKAAPSPKSVKKLMILCSAITAVKIPTFSLDRKVKMIIDEVRDMRFRRNVRDIKAVIP